MAEGLYLNTASCGLPPRPTVDALTAIHRDWAAGRVAAAQFDEDVTAARSSYARLVGVDPTWVAVGHQVSPLVGLVAGAVPDGAEVVVAAGDFTSVTFPFAAHAHRGVRVVEAPLARVAETVGADTALVALSLVQSADGAVADLDTVLDAADRHGAEVLLDLTQAAGWLHVDAGRVAYTVCGAYKWLLSPRGTAFLSVRPDLLPGLVPTAAGWYAGETIWDSIYGLPLRLAGDARRLDTSPAWFSWVGTRASLGFLEEIGVAALHEHAVRVERAFCEAADLVPLGQAIRALDVDAAGTAVLAERGVSAATRAGRLRVSFHVSTDEDEVADLGRALRGHVTG